MAGNLTKNELAILQALDSASDKILDFNDLRKTVGLTVRGFRTIINRMESAYLIGRAGFCQLTITFKGLRELADERVSA